MSASTPSNWDSSAPAPPTRQRSSTPPGQVTPEPVASSRPISHDEKNVHSFRVPPSASISPMKETLTAHQLISRFKATLNDMVDSIARGASDNSAAETFLQLAEEAVKSLRTAKVDAGTHKRRPAAATQPAAVAQPAVAPQPAVVPSPSPQGVAQAARSGGVPPVAPEPRGEAAKEPPRLQVRAPVSYAAAVRGKPSKTPPPQPSKVATTANPENAAGGTPVIVSRFADPTSIPAPLRDAPTADSNDAVEDSPKVDAEDVSPDVKPANPKSTSCSQSKSEDSPAKAARPALANTQLDLVEERQTSALRSEEKLREADERRRLRLLEKQQKADVHAERMAQVKARRDNAAEQAKKDTQERLAKGSQRAVEAVERTKEKAVAQAVHVEEVRFVEKLQHENRALAIADTIENKAHDAEQKRELRNQEVKQQQEERGEEYHAVLERGKKGEQQRIEKLQQKKAAEDEHLQRIDEQKKMEFEAKRVEHEQWERKIQEQQQRQQAQAEERSKRVEEKLEQSAVKREEQRLEQKQRLEKAEQRVRDAKERREGGSAETATGATFRDVINVITPMAPPEPSDKQIEKLKRVLAVGTRGSAQYLEGFQQSLSTNIKELNKSRIRAVVSRLNAVSATANAARQPLHDLLLQVANVAMSANDHAHLRYSNVNEIVVHLLTESAKTKDLPTIRLISDYLHTIFSDATEGPQHIEHFVRAGHIFTLLTVAREELLQLKRHNNSPTLTVAMSLTQLCLRWLLSSSQAAVSAVRASVLEYLDAGGIVDYCVAVASASVQEEDLPCLQYSLLILHLLLPVSVHRPQGMDWTRRLFESVTTLLSHLLHPTPQADVKPLETPSVNLSLVLFTAFRLLNAIARLDIAAVQQLMKRDSGSASAPANTAPKPDKEDYGANGASAFMTQFYHMILRFSAVVASNAANLERIEREKWTDDALAAANAEGLVPFPTAVPLTASFKDAIAFGTTLQDVPRAALPSTCSSIAPPGPAATASQSSAPKKPSGFLRVALHESFLLIGYLSLRNPAFQSMFCWGKEKPLISLLLSSLPVQYFALGRHILFPTLMSLCFECDSVTSVAKREMDLSELQQFLAVERAALPSLPAVVQSNTPAPAASTGTTDPPQAAATSTSAAPATSAGPKPALTNSATDTPRSQPLTNTSWADIDDDFHSDCATFELPPAEGSHEAVSAGAGGAEAAAAKAIPPPPVQLLPPSLLRFPSNAKGKSGSRAKVNSTPAYATYFRLDRRFPYELWGAFEAFLAKPAPSA